jgi:hypothetical protein
MDHLAGVRKRMWRSFPLAGRHGAVVEGGADEIEDLDAGHRSSVESWFEVVSGHRSPVGLSFSGHV